ncbi:MAG: hypothetical protein JWM07_327 [Candidatus Saccharibacteria bacterium]|nr:hypothetical protein [Candidatus Saccharibacteria bacterium]
MKCRIKVIIAPFVFVAFAFGLSACGSSTDQRNAVVADLEERGFENPTFVSDEHGSDDKMRFDVQVGGCHILIAKTESGDIRFADVSWTDEQIDKIRTKNGGNFRGNVDADFVRNNANELGWAHCLKK